MNTLTAHLTAGAGHSRLPLRSDCPVCREQRLSGPSPGLALRAQAGLVASALAASTLLPTTATATPQPPAPKTAQSNASPTVEPEEPAPTPDETQEQPIDEAPDLQNVLDDPDAGTDTDGDDVGAENPADVAPPPPTQTETIQPPAPPAPPAPGPQAEAPAPPATVPAPAPQAETGQAPVEPVAAPQRTHSWRLDWTDHLRHRFARRASDAPNASKPMQAQDTLAPTPGAAPAAAPVAAVSATAATGPTNPITGRVYTVRPGDSLWSIAKRLLPGVANAVIAREVQRLWERNRDQIASGDPDLLHVGTQLRLR